MTEKTDKKARNKAVAAPHVTEEEVRNWLIDHPDFLAHNADLLTTVIPPERVSGDGVVDMQSFLVSRLQKEVIHLTALQDDFVEAARNNIHTQDMVHASIQAVLGASNLAHFVHILTQDLPELLEIDVITLCVEDGPIPLPDMTGLQRLKAGSIKRAPWRGQIILLRSEAPKSKAIYGPAKDLVHSDALIKLDVPSLHAKAMIAFGSRQDGHFQEDQATDLLRFLAIVIQSCLQMWLEQKPA
ncbi:DUF484 family protein [Sneathiella sp. HT1-7]|uniref:DUF484 family protein n=1 Tax=Sneathiella sp. HT1-7 TaxID=2887192 RepID=UPI001D14A4FD|nr:DUF484 family protein [Sneathiella sp. HT1-7]MCC3303625.1 DUF484 family protein [Sneathiella sp. HT1-7]